MNNNGVPGLSDAIRLYVSDKIKDRVLGLEQLKDIFGSWDNVTQFHETACKEGGAGWVAFYQCLFGVVVMEKRLVLKKAGSATADKRLSDSIGLVRKIAEKTIHLLSKKPFIALFTHMVSLLVHGSKVFPPAALDYTKAIKTLLSYPPHLECLDQASWRRLAGVCWASLLGDPIRLDDDSQDELEDEEEESEVDVKPFEATQGANAHHRQKTLSTINSEIAGLLPILFSSSAAPLVSRLPERDTVYVPEPSTGLSMILKIHRFFTQYPNDNNAHLPILQSLNLILGEMELNAREEMSSASVKLLPQLANMWSTRKKDIREQVLIALRTFLPFAAHKITVEHDKSGAVREALGKIFDHLGKEGQLRWGCQPLDLSAIRLKLVSRKGKEKEDLSPFTTSITGAGFDFTHEFAVTWVIEELYADICYHLYDTSHSTQALTPTTQAGVKRRRIDNALSTLIANLDSGSTASRLLHVQILILLNERYYQHIHSEAQSEIRRNMLDLLDNDDTNVQSWALLALGHLALKERGSNTDSPPSESEIDEASLGQQETRQKLAQADWDRVWAHATRKIGITALSRAASHAANCLLACGLAKTARHLRDIRTILANIEVQGPSFPFDSVCAFLCTAVSIARNDATMYQQGLEDKVMGWLGKWSVLDGSRGKGRMDQHSAADLYRLLCESTAIKPLPFIDVESEELLPDCAVVERLLEEAKTRPLRRLILYALYPSKPAPNNGRPEAIESRRNGALMSIESSTGGLGVLEGRPRVATTFLTNSLDAFIRDWTSTDNHPSFPPDRVRKAIDLLVLALAYLGTLLSAGLHTDTACMQAAIKLVELVGPALAAQGHNLPGQHLMWAGLKPLASIIKPAPNMWPIMLNASIDSSGIRRSLFPQSESNDSSNRPKPEDELQQRIWRDPSMGAALKELFSTALGSLEAISRVSVSNGFKPYQQTTTTADDFGEIKIAESDTMPQSREAVECKTSSSNLLHLLARYRVCGALRASPSGYPGRDTPLINAWLSTEGPKFIQIGEVICDILRDGLLRLSLDAVDLVLGAIEEMAGSYAFARDEGLLQVALGFLAHSATIWLSPEAESSNLPERVIAVAKFLLTKTKRGQVASWKVRLALILFLDEYLDYDPTTSLWTRMSGGDEMQVDGSDASPFTYFLDALIDTDARVRIRAATSAAGIFYLSGLPPANHQDLYFQALARQPGQTNHWDSFMNHLLWKLNCCVASMSLRATTMFHLYEIPPTTNTVHQHFQAGLEAVAERLHLDSIATLFRPYATIICLSQVGSGQKTMMQPFRLYGFPTKAAFGANLLTMVGSSVLIEENGLTVVKDACEASSTSIDWAVQQVLPTAVALSLGDIAPRTIDQKAVDSEITKTFTKLPGFRNGKQVQEAVTSKIDLVIANLLVLLDLEATPAHICDLLQSHKTPSSDTLAFGQLLSTDDSNTNGGAAALSPSLSAEAVIATHAYCISRYNNASPTRIVFVALEILFKQMNSTFLASEERRYLRALALVVSLYVNTMRVDVILQVFLRETITRIDKTEYPDIVIQMLQWGFDQVSTITTGLEQMPEIMIQLGEVRHRLGKASAGEMGQATAAAIDAWLVSQIPTWTASEMIRDSLDFAMAFWPTEVTAMFENWREPNFVDLAFIADTRRSKSFSSMTLCSGLARGMPIGNREEHIDAFVKHVFWHLKATLSEETCTTEGVAGLLDLLAQVDGEIHAPDLSTANELSIDEVRAKYDQKLAGEPALMLRAILIGKVADLTQDKAYTLRSTALEVLRRSTSTIHELMGRGVFPGTSHPRPLLELLLPVDVPANVTNSNLDILGQTDTWIRRSRSSESWASKLSLLFCDVLAADDPFYRSFVPLLDLSAKTASEFLPWFVQALLSVGSAKRQEVAESRSAILSTYLTKVIQWSAASKNAIATIIKTVLHLRGFMPGFRTGVMAFNRWLEIDPVLLSEAAIKCGAYATAMSFLEILKDIRDDQVDLLDPRIQNIMYQIYSNVEDPDGFYGIQTRDISGALSRRLQHEKLSLRAFGLYGAAFETTSSKQAVKESIIPLMTNLHDIGFDRLASGIYKSARSDVQQEDEHDPLLLDLAWRTGDWDLPVSDELAITSQGSFYSCLQAVHRQRDQSVAKVLVDKAVRTEVGRLGELGLEQIAQIKQSSTNLVCLREIALWLDPETQSAISTGDAQGPSLQRLKTLNDSMDYPVAERLTATRLSLLRAAHARESKFLFGDMTTQQTVTILDLQKSLYLQLGRLARKDGKLQASINAITAVQNLEIGTTGSDEANDEFGHVLWAQKEHALAIQHLEQMMGALKQTAETGGRMAVLLAQTAHWTSVAKMRAPQDIRGFFDKAYNLIRPSKLGRAEQARICHEYALFADGHYQSLSKSPELERLRTTRDRTLAVLENIESASKTSKSKSASARTDQSRHQDVLEDDRALKDLENELTTYAKTAMKMFAVSLTASDEFDDSITRLCSLWLEHDSSEEVNRSFSGPLQAIPSHKFIFLGPQLAARLYKPKQPVQFNSSLNSLMLRMARDHPFHILYQIITVAHGADKPANGSTSSKARRTSDIPMEEGRMPAALEILDRLRGDNDRPLARDAANQMSRFTAAAVPWCHYQEKEKKSSRGEQPQIPSGTSLLGFTNVKIPPPSVIPPVDLSKRYDHVATIQRYRTHYRILGGIHRPKRMTCIDSSGREHYELFKGDDELRQDAVMEQVFEMTNRILSRDRKTKARSLRFRTYAVIPLPNRSGVMEFVGDSQAIGEYLKPAHIKYREGIDHPPDHMRKKLEEIQVKDHNSSELPKRYTELITKFKPVMRHYFTEKHREPMAWFSMRLNYIRSVAVTSIVGHILGIGDRHCSNILIDKLTGELVHIDFGIVFEDGRRLRIPERVPFRLTNDIVDGLGLTGVDGTFRQCSEHTLRVLRESSDLILTVLEVFKHDPLYAWAADTEKLKRAQGGGRVEGQSASATEKADRVLNKIRQKLRPDLSVEYTVNQLIQEARNVDNLAKIFIGWQPWL